MGRKTGAVWAIPAILAAAVAGPAQADDNVFAPSSYAWANFGGSAPPVQAEIRNGVAGDVYGGVGATVAASTDGYYNQADVATGNGSAFAKADLHAGTVKGLVANGIQQTPRGSAQARIQDTVFFNNSSGSVVYLPFSFSFDGRITDPNDFGGNAVSIFTIAGALGTCPGGGYGTCYGDYSVRLASGASANQTLTIGYAGNGSQNGVQQGGAFFFNAPDNVDLTSYTVTKSNGPVAGYYNTVVSSVLALPAGDSRIGFDLRLIIDCWVVLGAVCDFGDTSAFGFGDLPEGLSFASASGVFLTGDPVAPGVPEPAAWVLLIAGFALTGVVQRHRRNAVVAA